MVLSKEQKIIKLVKNKKYEEALGIGLNDTRKVISEAHMKLSFEFSDDTDVQNALNQAKSILIEEDDIKKGRRFAEIGKYEEALPYLKKAAKLRGDWIDYNWLGSTLSILKCYAAINHLKKYSK